MKKLTTYTALLLVLFLFLDNSLFTQTKISRIKAVKSGSDSLVFYWSKNNYNNDLGWLLFNFPEKYIENLRIKGGPKADWEHTEVWRSSKTGPYLYAKTQRQHHKDGKVESEIQFTPGEKQLNSYKTDYAYDSLGRLHKRFYWLGTEDGWRRYDLNIYEYDEQNRLKSDTFFHLNKLIDEYYYVSLRTYDYDSSNNLIAFSHLNHEYDNWGRYEYDNHIDSFFYENGRLIEKKVIVGSPDLYEDYRYDYKEKYHYDSNGLKTQTDYYFFKETKKWEFGGLAKFTYDSNNNLTQNHEEFYGEGYVNYIKIQNYTYIDNAIDSIYTLYWAFEDQPYFRPYNMIKVTNNKYKQPIKTKIFYSLSSIEENKSSTIHFYYEEFDPDADYNYNTGIKNTSKTSFKVYPNPAQNSIMVSGLEESSEYMLYDLSGRLLQSGQVLNIPTPIHTGDLSNGIYLLKIGQQQEKIVIQK